MKYISCWMLLCSILFFVSPSRLHALPLTPPKKEVKQEQQKNNSKIKRHWSWKKSTTPEPKDKRAFPYLSASSLFFGLLWIAFFALQVNLFSFYWIFVLISALAAIILGVLGLKKEQYKRLAVAGIVFGGVGLLGGLMYLFTAVLML